MIRHRTFTYQNDFFAYEASRPTHEEIADMVESIQRRARNSKERILTASVGDTMVVFHRGKDPFMDEIVVCKILSLADSFQKHERQNGGPHNHGNEWEILKCPLCRPTKRLLRSEMKKIIER